MLNPLQKGTLIINRSFLSKPCCFLTRLTDFIYIDLGDITFHILSLHCICYCIQSCWLGPTTWPLPPNLGNLSTAVTACHGNTREVLERNTEKPCTYIYIWHFLPLSGSSVGNKTHTGNDIKRNSVPSWFGILIWRLRGLIPDELYRSPGL